MPLQQEKATTYAHCWRIKRKDGVTLGFTDHDIDITVEQGERITYFASTANKPGALERYLGFDIDNLEIKGVIESDLISPDDLLAGRFSGAEVLMSLVNYMEPDTDSLLLLRGYVGEVKFDGERFSMEVVSIKQKLASTSVVEAFSPSCRACLGDKRCKVKLENFTIESIKILEMIDQYSLKIELPRPIQQYLTQFHLDTIEELEELLAAGYVVFRSGRNQGTQRTVKVCKRGTLVLVDPFIDAVAADDTLDLVLGCDKNFQTCRKVFRNTSNFRGEPHIPNQQHFKV